MDKRMQRAKINAASTLVQQLVATVCGMLIPWIMIDTFGSVAYGATTSIAQFLAYISLFEGGIGRVARGALYKPLADQDENEISRIYLAIKRFFRILGIAFIGYVLILSLFYYDIADVKEFSREYIFALVLAIAIGKFAEYMGGISNITLFNADQRQYVVNSVVIVTSIVNVILIALLANAGVGIFWVKLGSSLIFVLKPIIYTIYLKTHYRIKKTKQFAVLKNKATGIAQHIAYVIQNNANVLILTVCADLKAVAVYSVYHLVCFSIRNITASLTGGMEAVFGDMIAKNEHNLLCRIYERYKLLLTLMTITLFGTTAIMIVPFVKLYTVGVSDAEYAQPVFGLLLALSYAINCLILPCTNLPIAASKLKESKWGAYGEAAINLIVSFGLVFWNPLVGIAVGALAAALFKSIYYIVFSAKHILRANVARLLRDFFISLAVLVLVSVGGMAIASHIPLYNYWRWIIGGFCTVTITGVISLLVGTMLYPEMMKKYASDILGKITRSKNVI